MKLSEISCVGTVVGKFVILPCGGYQLTIESLFNSVATVIKLVSTLLISHLDCREILCTSKRKYKFK